MAALPIVFRLRRAALLAGTISLLAYPVLALFMTRFIPTSDRMITLHVMDAAPYGVALSVAAICLAQHISYRHRAQRDPKTSTADYVLATIVHSIIWTAATLISIPLTTVLLIISAFLLS